MRDQKEYMRNYISEYMKNHPGKRAWINFNYRRRKKGLDPVPEDVYMEYRNYVSTHGFLRSDGKIKSPGKRKTDQSMFEAYLIDKQQGRI